MKTLTISFTETAKHKERGISIEVAARFDAQGLPRFGTFVGNEKLAAIPFKVDRAATLAQCRGFLLEALLLHPEIQRYVKMPTMRPKVDFAGVK